ncbi:hypothetical protein COL922a_013633, partial [Colletotrichum nupharicola]
TNREGCCKDDGRHERQGAAPLDKFRELQGRKRISAAVGEVLQLLHAAIWVCWPDRPEPRPARLADDLRGDGGDGRSQECREN